MRVVWCGLFLTCTGMFGAAPAAAEAGPALSLDNLVQLERVETARHTLRRARIERIREVAQLGQNEALQKRAARLDALEDLRHTARTGALAQKRKELSAGATVYETARDARERDRLRADRVRRRAVGMNYDDGAGELAAIAAVPDADARPTTGTAKAHKRQKQKTRAQPGKSTARKERAARQERAAREKPAPKSDRTSRGKTPAKKRSRSQR